MLGLDYAWTKPPVAAVKAAGYGFVCRYLSWLPNGKVIDQAEAREVLLNGVDIFLNWEDAATDELGGAAAGTAQATEAVRQAKALGYPAGATIYFSGDIDETPAQAVPVAAYFAAAAPIVRAAGYRIGGYGGYWYIKRLFDAKLIDDGWQTYAWSGGLWDPRATLRQIRNGITVGGADCDENETTGVAHSWLHPETTNTEDAMAMIVKDNATGKVYAVDGVNAPYLIPAGSLNDALFISQNPADYTKGQPVPVDDLAAFGPVPGAVTANTVAPVDVNALAEALATNATFLRAVAVAVNDDAEARAAAQIGK